MKRLLKTWGLRLGILVLVLGLFALLLLTHSEGRSGLGTTENFGLPETAGYDLTDELTEEVEAFSEGGLTMYVAAGGAVRVEDASGRTVWRNTAREEDRRLLGTEDAAVSPLSLVYRYEGETDITLYSGADAADAEQYTVSYSDDGTRLRVTYLFGEVGQSGILPYGITQECMENEILPKLSESEQSYLLRRYTLYTAETAKTVVRETCPGVSKTPLYYLEDCAAVAMKNRTTAYLAQAGMTEELYAAQCALTGEKPADYTESYLVTAEYWLENGDIMVNIPCSEILFHPENPLTTLTLNGAATYAAATEQGAYLLPAGSGATQPFAAAQERNNRYAYYGRNLLDTEEQIGESTFPFPVYGVLRENGDSLLCIIEEGAEVAELNERFSEGASQLTLSLRLTSYGNSSVTAQQSSTVFNPSVYTGNFTVRYRPCTGHTATELAAVYRTLLLEQGKLPEAPVNTDAVLLELIGNVAYSYQWAGLLPVTSDRELTTYAQAQEMVQFLHEAGITPTVKLSGFNKNGLYCQRPGDITFASCLGSRASRDSLFAYLRETDTTAFLELNLAYTYTGKSQWPTGYRAQRESARQANNRSVTAVLKSLSTGDALAKAGTLHVTAPSRYLSYAESYREALPEGIGASLGDSFLTLSTDFSEQSPQNRADTLKALTAAASLLGETHPVMTQNPVLSVLGALSMSENLDRCGENGYALDAYVPFVQTVLHGHVNYASRALNAQSDYREALLSAVETGSAVKFTLAGRYTVLQEETEYDYLYYIDWEKWKDTVRTDAAAVNRLYDRIRTAELVSLQREGDLTRTVYSNGVTVYVNRGEEPVQADGITVPARGFASR